MILKIYFKQFRDKKNFEENLILKQTWTIFFYIQISDAKLIFIFLNKLKKFNGSTKIANKINKYSILNGKKFRLFKIIWNVFILPFILIFKNIQETIFV